MTLIDLANEANKIEERLFDGHLVHFDACSLIKDSDSQIREFINLTGTSLVTGFSYDVDFIESLALEMIFIDYLGDYRQPYSAYKKIVKNHSELCKRTGFIAVR